MLPLPARLLRIGRTPDNDLVLFDLSVSRHHAELRKSSSGKFEIVDLGSHNGTLVNGQRVTSATPTEKDIVSVGHATFRLTDSELREYINAGDVSLAAPSLLFLDEPTSGLDPGLDKSVMEQMRDLAHDGRTVIAVTHSVANLDVCDRLLVLVRRYARVIASDRGYLLFAALAGAYLSSKLIVLGASG